jgi:hypothetical protein
VAESSENCSLTRSCKHPNHLLFKLLRVIEDKGSHLVIQKLYLPGPVRLGHEPASVFLSLLPGLTLPETYFSAWRANSSRSMSSAMKRPATTSFRVRCRGGTFYL